MTCRDAAISGKVEGGFRSHHGRPGGKVEGVCHRFVDAFGLPTPGGRRPVLRGCRAYEASTRPVASQGRSVVGAGVGRWRAS